MKFENKPVLEIKKEGRLFTLAALLSVAELEGRVDDLQPKKLVYNIFGNIKSKKKKEIGNESEETFDECMDESAEMISGDAFIERYKSLCGHLLQEKYSYEDYLKGGLSLLNKNEFLKKVYQAVRVEEIVAVLLDEYEKVYHEEHEQKVGVNRRKYVSLKIAMIVVAVLLAVSCAYIVYNYMRETRIDKAYIAGHEAYLNRDYPLCINSLAGVDISDLDKSTKMIIAVSTVKTDNLTQEQKDNITNDVVNSDTEIVYEYWIKLSRNMYEEAETTAKQLSDDELLLYAYMKESLYLKNNTSVEGEEKAARLATLQTEIDKLSKAYEVKEEDKETKGDSILR